MKLKINWHGLFVALSKPIRAQPVYYPVGKYQICFSNYCFRNSLKQSREISTLQTLTILSSKSFDTLEDEPVILKDSNLGSNKSSDSKFTQFLDKLENEKGNFQIAISLFNKFQLENPNWIEHWPSQKIAATILHIYSKAGLHNAALALHDQISKQGFKHGEGIYKTLIKCCLATKDWKRALKYFESLENKSLRNIRIYPDLIKHLAQNKELKIAYKLFEEMRSKELTQRTRKQLNDQEMLIALVQESIDLSKEEETLNLSVQVFSSVLGYLKERCIHISSKLSHVISKWVHLQPDWSIDVTETNFKSCPKSLNIDTENSAKEIIYFMQEIKCSLHNSFQLIEFQKLEEFLKEQGPFDVVVDGANVMLAAEKGRRNHQTTLQPENLMQILENDHIKDRKVAVIIPKSLERRSNFSQSREYKLLMDSARVNFFCACDIPDDLVVLFVALKSELLKIDKQKIVSLITNDSLRNHIPLAKHEQWKFLRWIRFRQIKFFWNSRHHISVERNWASTPSLKYTWLLLQEDGKEINISQRLKYQ